MARTTNSEAKFRGVMQRKDKNNAWYARVYHEGKPTWRRCTSKSQAKEVYNQLKAQAREGRLFEKPAKADALTLKGWIGRYLDGSTNIGKENEVTYAARWIEEYGEKLLAELTSDDVRQMQAKMRATTFELKVGQRKPIRRWSDATINRHLAFIRRVCTLAVNDGKLTRNPVTGIAFFPESNRTRYFSIEELAQIEAHMSPQDWTLVAIAFETGLRRGEQFGLRWDQVDLEQQVLTIPISKSGKTRHVVLTPAAVAMFRSLDSWQRSPWVFPGSRKADAPMDIRAFLRRAYNPALRRAGITGANWHTLRHTCASHHVMAGTHLNVVQTMLGHADYATTQRYAHLAPAHVREAIERGSLSQKRLETVPQEIGYKTIPKTIPQHSAQTGKTI